MPDLSQFTPEQFNIAQKEIIGKTLVSSNVHPVHNACGFLLGGQSGAGKTTLHSILRKRFNNNVIIINGDGYRNLHPHYHELEEAYGDDWVNYTANWASEMMETLVNTLSRQGYNLVVEGTLRTSEAPMKTAKLLRSRGYSVSLALMAVKPEISFTSCQIRYEEMRIAGTIPRSVDPAHHEKIIRAIVENLGVLEQSNLFDGIYLYNRSKTQLFPPQANMEEDNPHTADTASEVLRETLFGPWTPEELEHLNYLEEKLEHLRNL